MKYLENDVHLNKKKTILDHHPGLGMPPHGTLRKANAHQLKCIDPPKNKRPMWTKKG